MMRFSFLYEFDEEKSKLLYSYSKERIPNAVTSTCFKKHFHEFLNKRHEKEDFSSLFYYLPSTTNRKEKINQFKDNMSLNAINCSLKFLNLLIAMSCLIFDPIF